MNTRLKTKWLKALRGGEYKQGHRKLCSDGKYCCLGVLYDLTGKKWMRPKVKGAGRRTQSGSNATIYAYDEELHIGLAAMTKLANMNDGHNEPRADFLEIADYIEANL